MAHKYKVGHIDLILIKHHNLLNSPEIPEFSYVSHLFRFFIKCHIPCLHYRGIGNIKMAYVVYEESIKSYNKEAVCICVRHLLIAAAAFCLEFNCAAGFCHNIVYYQDALRP